MGEWGESRLRGREGRSLLRRPVERRRDLLGFAAAAGAVGIGLLTYSAYFLSVQDWSDPAVRKDLDAAADVHLRDAAFALVGATMLAVAVACLWSRSSGTSRGPRRLVGAGTIILGALVLVLAGAGLFAGIASAWIAAAGTLILTLIVIPAVRQILAGAPSRSGPPVRPAVTVLLLLLATWAVAWPGPGGPAGAVSPEAAVSGWVDALATGNEDRALDLAYPDPRLYSRTSRAARVAETLAQVGGRLRVDAVRITDRSLDGVVGARLFGSVDRVPVCGYLSLHRYDEDSLLRRIRADGRWFVLPVPFSAQALDGTACELIGYGGPTG